MTPGPLRTAFTMFAVLAVLCTACSDESSDGRGGGTDQREPVEEGADQGGEPQGGEAQRDEAARDFSAVDSVLESFVADNELNGAGLVVVEADEGIVHEDYVGDFDADRVSLIASSSKMLSAGVLLHLADEGLLEMDTPITEQLDWEGDSQVTPAQLVSNSSGLVGLLPNPTYAPYLCQYLSEGAGDLQECGRSILLNDEDDAEVVPPDTEFRYGGGQWQVAGAVAEAVSGKSWDELIREIYVEPCGVESLAYNNHFTQLPSDDPFVYPPDFYGDPSVLAPTDNPNIEGGAYVTAADYAALLSMQLDGGRCGDTQVLSAEALDAMHSDRILEVYDGDAVVEGATGGTGGADQGYGMGWWVDRDTDRLRDPGAYGAVAQLDLDDGYGVYVVVEASSDVGLALMGSLTEEIAQVMEA